MTILYCALIFLERRLINTLYYYSLMFFTLTLECVDDSTGSSHKMGDIYNDGCNDCTCMDTGVIQCTEKFCDNGKY